MNENAQRKDTGIKSFSFLCRRQRIVWRKVSTNCRMAALSGCFLSSSCLLLREYWNVVPNNTNIREKELKIRLPFKTWCSLSVPQCTVSNEGNWNSLPMETIKNAPTCFIARTRAQHLSVFYIQECRNKISWTLHAAWFACQKILPGPHILAFEFTSYHWSHLHLKEFFRLPLISSRNIHPNWLKYFGSSGQVHFLRWTVWIGNPAGSVHQQTASQRPQSYNNSIRWLLNHKISNH